MRKSIKILAAGCFCTAFMGSMTAFGAMNLETESPVAGGAVALNNYFAGSSNPEEDLVRTVTSTANRTLASENTQKPAQSAVQKEVPQVTAARSAYENVAISQVSEYVNVRTQPNTTSEVVGKIYNNCAATILASVNGEGGEWYQIQSGSVNGYIKAQYFITGSQAEAKAKSVGKEYATVSGTPTLRLRESPDLESKTLTLLAEGANYVVLEETGDFVKLAVDSDLEGYVFKDYIKTSVEFEKAVSLAEEQAKAADEAKRKKDADDAIKQLEEAKKQESKKKAEAAKETTAAPTTAAATQATTAAQKPIEDNNAAQTIAANPAGDGNSSNISAPPTEAPKSTTAAETTKETTAKETTASKGPVGPGGDSSDSSPEVTTATRNAIVAYAKQFLGNPYVYGGTSLTNGADCSGFTMQIYAHFGISTGRSSRDQAAKGREISVSAVQPGDLLFYASGNYINHVAMYIGGGQVIHASTPTSGITTAPSNYRTPCKAVTFLD